MDIERTVCALSDINSCYQRICRYTYLLWVLVNATSDADATVALSPKYLA